MSAAVIKYILVHHSCPVYTHVLRRFDGTSHLMFSSWNYFVYNPPLSPLIIISQCYSLFVASSASHFLLFGCMYIWTCENSVILDISKKQTKSGAENKSRQNQGGRFTFNLLFLSHVTAEGAHLLTAEMDVEIKLLCQRPGTGEVGHLPQFVIWLQTHTHART